MVQIDASHFSRGASVEFSEALAKPASYKIVYFPIIGNGGVSRDLLAYGGVEWSAVSPADWKAEKALAPFHVLPLLIVTGENGKTVTLAETVVIEQYLGKKFSLLGTNEYEENVVRMLHNSSACIMNTFSKTVTWTVPEAKAGALAFFLSSTLPEWIAAHERHLIDNGNNGYYLGDKLSLADIRTAIVIEHFATQVESKDLMALINKSAPLIKLRDTVAKHPKLAQWRSGNEYKTFYDNNIAFYANPATFKL